MTGRVLLILVQLAIVAGLAAHAEWTLQHGTRVRLETEPVDPRTLFQGDYVRLDYPIARTPAPFQTARGDTVWLTLVPQGDVWSVAGVSRERPAAPAIALRATTSDSAAGRLTLGLETMFRAGGRGPRARGTPTRPQHRRRGRGDARRRSTARRSAGRWPHCLSQRVVLRKKSHRLHEFFGHLCRLSYIKPAYPLG
jgi:hypothetical protein